MFSFVLSDKLPRQKERKSYPLFFLSFCFYLIHFSIFHLGKVICLVFSLSLSLSLTQSSAPEPMSLTKHLSFYVGPSFNAPKSLTHDTVWRPPTSLTSLSLIICRFHLFPLSFNCFYSKYYIKLNYYCTTLLFLFFFNLVLVSWFFLFLFLFFNNFFEKLFYF